MERGPWGWVLGLVLGLGPGPGGRPAGQPKDAKPTCKLHGFFQILTWILASDATDPEAWIFSILAL